MEVGIEVDNLVKMSLLNEELIAWRIAEAVEKVSRNWEIKLARMICLWVSKIKKR